jgi:hypothetical protein
MNRGKFTLAGMLFYDQFAGRVEKAARATALAGEQHAKAVVLNQPGEGKEYPRGKTKLHRASTPGRAPAPDTGRMRASTTSEIVREGDAITSRTSVNVEYAEALEQGTERIAPRPFKAAILEHMRKSLPIALRRFVGAL